MEENKDTPPAAKVKKKIVVKSKQDGMSWLKPPEKRFIDEHWSQPGWSDAKIAEHLGRNIETIVRYRKKKGYSKDTGKPQIVVPKPLDKEEKRTINKKDRAFVWKTALLSSSRFASIKDKLTNEDKDYFVDQWCSYHVQFEDMTVSEEDALELLILLKLRLLANQKSLKSCRDYQQELEDQIRKLGNPEIDVEIEQQRQLREMTLQLNKNEIELNKEYRELVDKYEKILRAMSATREQREARQTIGGDTFTSLVKQFNDRDKRREIGKYNALMKLASEKKTHEFKQPYEFADKNIEPIILDGKDYAALEKERKELDADSTS